MAIKMRLMTAEARTACWLYFLLAVLIGAFMSIPIWLNILIWDLTFMGGRAAAFTVRLSVYLVWYLPDRSSVRIEPTSSPPYGESY